LVLLFNTFHIVPMRGINVVLGTITHPPPFFTFFFWLQGWRGCASVLFAVFYSLIFPPVRLINYLYNHWVNVSLDYWMAIQFVCQGEIDWGL